MTTAVIIVLVAWNFWLTYRLGKIQEFLAEKLPPALDKVRAKFDATSERIEANFALMIDALDQIRIATSLKPPNSQV